MTTSQETNKDAYTEKLQAQIDQWTAEVEKLEAKARESKADAKIEIEENVGDAKKRLEAAKTKAREVRNASGEAWQELKAGTESAFESLKEAVDRARTRFQ